MAGINLTPAVLVAQYELLIGGTGYIILVVSRNATLSYVAVYMAAW
jgi:hypothetical protein